MPVNDKFKIFCKNLPVLVGQEFNPWAVLAHAWHESGGFEHVIGDWNFWGIKRPQKRVWNGKTIELYTHEYVRILESDIDEKAALLRISKLFGVNNVEIEKIEHGSWFVKIPQQFIDFPSCDVALIWYGNDLIRTLYPEAYSNRGVPCQFFSWLVDGVNKYATDITYKDKLCKLYETLQKDSEITKYVSDSYLKGT